jgi:hypothetical protein
MKKIIILITIILLTVLIRFSLSSHIFIQKFNKDAAYKKYYLSQWVIPQSKNPISDEDLYQVAGYELVTTGTHFKINPEVPPLGKLVFGWSILLFNNPFIISFILYIVSGILFFAISEFIIKNTYLRFVALILFFMDPLITSMSYMTLLDLPQLVALLAHILIFFIYLRKKKHTFVSTLIFSTLLGITFGAFAAIKIALLSAVILGADVVILFRRKLWLPVFIMLVISLITYVATYFSYFLQGHSIIELLKAQKWMLTFYKESKAKPVYGTVFTSILTGYIKGWYEGATWDRVKEWSFVWPIVFILTIILLCFRIKNILKNNYLLYSYLLIVGLLGMYIIIPFFARYLVLLIPLLILCSTYFIENLMQKYGK